MDVVLCLRNISAHKNGKGFFNKTKCFSNNKPNIAAFLQYYIHTIDFFGSKSETRIIKDSKGSDYKNHGRR